MVAIWRRMRLQGFLVFLLCGAALAGEPACPAVDLVPAAPDVWVARPSGLTPARANCGRSAASIVLVGRAGAVVVDPGPQARAGRDLLAAMKRAGLPAAVAVIDSHPHPENVLANAAMGGLPIYASASTAALMGRRCPRCRANLKQTLGEDLMRGTRIVLPTRVLHDDQRLALGGVPLHVLAFAQAHAEGDVALLEARSRTLITAGLAYGREVPDMHEASLTGWIAALQRLAALSPRQVVASHGDSDDPLGDTLAYLTALRDAVQAELEAGTDLTTALERIQLERFAGWAGYAERHGLNVQHAWLELERAAFERP